MLLLRTTKSQTVCFFLKPGLTQPTHLKPRLSIALLLSEGAQGGDTYCSEQRPQLESGTNLQRDKKENKIQLKIKDIWKACFKGYTPDYRTRTHK